MIYQCTIWLGSHHRERTFTQTLTSPGLVSGSVECLDCEKYWCTVWLGSHGFTSQGLVSSRYITLITSMGSNTWDQHSGCAKGFWTVSLWLHHGAINLHKPHTHTTHRHNTRRATWPHHTWGLVMSAASASSSYCVGEHSRACILIRSQCVITSVWMRSCVVRLVL